MDKNNNWLTLAGVILFILGLFLVLDSLIFHLITFDYASIGIAWLDQYLDHWMIGIIFIIISIIGLYKHGT